MQEEGVFDKESELGQRTKWECVAVLVPTAEGVKLRRLVVASTSRRITRPKCPNLSGCSTWRYSTLSAPEPPPPLDRKGRTREFMHACGFYVNNGIVAFSGLPVTMFPVRFLHYSTYFFRRTPPLAPSVVTLREICHMQAAVRWSRYMWYA